MVVLIDEIIFRKAYSKNTARRPQSIQRKPSNLKEKPCL
jgi:hypothetical protein